ncbi:MAG: polysaccharide deacetylase family protein [Cytophagales bacterium]|nr:polysaccharide deacetylase family protein [Cytophagales bacterium]
MSIQVGFTQTTAEKLGYDKDAILLILHADDLGVANSVNAATIAALEEGTINSASIMVPCPWFPQAAAYAKENPEMDLGLHLTLTAEWDEYKWDGVSSASEISSLLNEEAHFPPSVAEVVQSATVKELEKELIAQVERALAFGIKPTHLDSHMGTLFQTPAFFEAYQRVGKRYKIPVFIPYGHISAAPQLVNSIMKDQILVDRLFSISPAIGERDWNEYYMDILRNMKPGLNEIIVHFAYDNAEMQAVAVNHPDFGSAWRQRDLEALQNQAFKDLIKERNIHLVSWRDIQEAQYGE